MGKVHTMLSVVCITQRMRLLWLPLNSYIELLATKLQIIFLFPKICYVFLRKDNTFFPFATSDNMIQLSHVKPRRGDETTGGGATPDEGELRQTECRRYDRAGRPVTPSGLL